MLCLNMISTQVYDYFLTLDAEVNLMWPSKMSPIKVLYFLARYSVLIDTIISLKCEFFSKTILLGRTT